MDCEHFREALSASMDQEAFPAGVTAPMLEDHLAGCASCRLWLAGVERLQSLARMEALPAVPDLRGGILQSFDRAADRESASPVWVVAALRVALVLVSAMQLAVAIPVLFLGHEREAPVHVAHEMGSFELALVLAVLVAVWRPVWASPVALMALGASILLVGTALSDLFSGATTWRDEAPHVLVVVAAVLLITLARRGGSAPLVNPGVLRRRMAYRAGWGIWPARTLRFGGREPGWRVERFAGEAASRGRRRAA
jgi:predicted anti-sigma-YlaC factor YlaD